MLFRVTARCIIMRDSSVLVQLSKHGDFYRLPGGRVRPEETLVQGLQRELREELGLDRIDNPLLLYVVDSFYRRRNGIVHELGFYFLCDGVDPGEVEPKESHLRVKWVKASEITPDSFRPSVLAAYLKELLASSGLKHYRAPIYLVNIDVGGD
ncbi:MAG: hypothetical protein DSY37_01965 [Hyperthermus sp.]|nr:MAG: hypothetical protein DSY37_01965 [Hyperthermus sp.]